VEESITLDNYAQRAMRTDTPITPALLARFQEPQTIRLIHAAMGMVTEVGEFTDMLKRHLFYGKPIDFVNAQEEVGDQYWYLALAVDALNTTIHEVMTTNIEKLLLRFPGAFSETAALSRDVKQEQAFLQVKSGLSPCPKGVAKTPQPHLGTSKKGRAWDLFAEEVFSHVEDYVVPQYGDDGEDPYAENGPASLLNQAEKYIKRHGRNMRVGQEKLDLLKAAHCLQMAYARLCKEEERPAPYDNQPGEDTFPEEEF